MTSRRRFLAQSSLVAGSAFFANAVAQDRDAALLEHAKSLLEKAPLIDTHNDSAFDAAGAQGGRSAVPSTSSKPQPTLCADIPSMREGRLGVQYWSVFVESSTQVSHTALHETMREFDVALRLIRSRPEFEQARTAADIERIHASGRIACLMGVEGGHMIENSPAALRMFYELGGRYLTLTHWDNVDWADSATDRPLHFGLTEFGKRIVKELNRLGMFVDLSHVSADYHARCAARHARPSDFLPLQCVRHRSASPRRSRRCAADARREWRCNPRELH